MSREPGLPSLTLRHAVARPDLLLGAAVAIIQATDAPAIHAPAPPAPDVTGPDAVRAAVRDLLRNGRYRPTGRGKPASEYLARAALENRFPVISPSVDAANRLSLAWGLPISLWDLDKAVMPEIVVRLGRTGESYVFNPAGQVLELEDLLVGCRARSGDDGEPIVSPVKDSLLTRTDSGTRRVGAIVYAPVSVDRADLAARVRLLAEHLAGVGGTGAVGTVVGAGETVSLGEL